MTSSGGGTRFQVRASEKEKAREFFLKNFNKPYQPHHHFLSGDAGRCLGRSNRATNSVDYLSYGTVLKRQKAFADGLLQLGLKPHSSKVGIYSANSPEYVLAEYGAYRHSLVVVPIYDTLGTNVASFIANQAQLSVVAVDKLERVEKVVEQATAFTSLRHLVLMNSGLINEEIRAKGKQKGKN